MDFNSQRVKIKERYNRLGLGIWGGRVVLRERSIDKQIYVQSHKSWRFQINKTKCLTLE